ncbi:MAG TPA: GTP cyclohydrolase I [Thalassobaculum sp.]
MEPAADDRRTAAEAGIRDLLRAVGEDPDRDGLRETPARVVRAFAEYCAGYAQDPVAELRKTFDEVSGYQSLIILTDIDFVSHCEHHLAPIVGRAHVAYLPSTAVVGISKLARVVDAYARRLQIQERMTAEIADCIEAGLSPRGVGVIVDAEHGCMTLRGVRKQAPRLRTQVFTGALATDPLLQQRFIDSLPPLR